MRPSFVSFSYIIKTDFSALNFKEGEVLFTIELNPNNTITSSKINKSSEMTL